MRKSESNGRGEAPRQTVLRGESVEKRAISVVKGVRRHFMEYCSNTTIHGLKYLGEEHRPLMERVCWLVIFALSLVACGHLILQVWDKWDKRPVIVSFAERSTPVWQVPFPAITICSETKARRSKLHFTELIEKFEDPNYNLTEQELGCLGKMSLLCDLQHYTDGDPITDTSVIQFFREVGLQFDDVLFYIKWKNKMVNTTAMFSPLVTEEGICYTFNMLDSRDLFTEEYYNDGDFLNHGIPSPGWSLDEGYRDSAGVSAYPHRALGAGAKAGLFLVMRAFTEDLDYLCMGPVQGFKVLLHSPAEIPRVREQYLRVPLNQELVVRISPGMMTTSEGLRGYSPQRRQCYFPSERHLRFFKVYTQNNCALECLTNFTLRMCGCVAFHMPRDRSMPICGSGKIKCMNDAREKLLVREIEQGLRQRLDTPTSNINDCDCLQACTVLHYDAETSQADFDWTTLIPVKSLNLTPSGLNVARLSVSFKNMQFITSRRSELYGQTDFLANCGGLLGLFMGFSILSLVEIIYYLTLRVCCVHRWVKKAPQKEKALYF